MKTAQEMQAHLREKAEADEGFRVRLLADPTAAIREALDVEIPEGFTIHVHEDGPATAHLVIPQPAAELGEEELKMASGGFGGMAPQWW